MIDGTDFHDATLLTLSMSWSTGDVVIALRLSRAPVDEVELAISGATRVVCPRELPWGRSVSVNSLRSSVDEQGACRLEIEMQSGDVINVVGRAVHLHPRAVLPPSSRSG